MDCASAVACLQAIDFSAVENLVGALGSTAVAIAVVYGIVAVVVATVRKISAGR